MFEALPSQLGFHAVQLVVFGSLLFLAERRLPVRPDQGLIRDESSLDLTYSFFLVFLSPFFTYLFVFLFQSILTNVSGLAAMTGLRSSISQLPIFMQVLLAILFVDFVGYWRHRLMHAQVLWSFHAIHHSSRTLDWLSTDRFHPVNHLVTTFLSFLTLSLFFDPLAAALSMQVRRVYGLYVHTNLKISYGVLDKIFVSPLVHHWHHSNDEEARDKNFATFFSAFDSLFGTFYLPDNKVFPARLGVEADIPSSLWAQFLFSFRTHPWAGATTALVKQTLQRQR